MPLTKENFGVVRDWVGNDHVEPTCLHFFPDSNVHVEAAHQVLFTVTVVGKQLTASNASVAYETILCTLHLVTFTDP